MITRIKPVQMRWMRKLPTDSSELSLPHPCGIVAPDQASRTGEMWGHPRFMAVLQYNLPYLSFVLAF